MKVDFNVTAKAFNGEDLKDQTGGLVFLNKSLAQAVAGLDPREKPIEKYELAHKLYNASGEIEITEAEKSLIKEACALIPIMVSAPILILVNNAK
ncbi:MAG: hypothetical protein J6U47_00650 [Bacteroidales bacterium]|nr:hypothetical protein [Bacteroidales bacterium]